MTTMNQDEAFIDEAPQRLLPWSPKTVLLTTRAVTKAGADMDDINMLAAYKLVSGGELFPTRQRLEECFAEMDDAEVEEITAYIARVSTRRKLAEVEVETQPGK